MCCTLQLHNTTAASNNFAPGVSLSNALALQVTLYLRPKGG